MKLALIFVPAITLGATVSLAAPAAPGPDGSSELDARAVGCLPNYQGSNLYIQSSDKAARWQVKTLKEGSVLSVAKGAKNTWRIEQTGQPQNDFIIKAGQVSDNGLLVKPFKATELALAAVQGAGNPSYQIICDTCSDPGLYPTAGLALAKGCTIIDTSTGLYVTEDTSGGTLSRKAKAKAGQKWDMVSVGWN